ncbi:MAG: glycosyltransferase, partial [Puniceicoccaceae bacterium]
VALEGGVMIAREALPRILFLSYESLDNTHGTGVLLQRMFRDFPRENLFAVSVVSTGGSPWLENQILLPDNVFESECARLLQQTLKGHTFSPQIVYSTAFNENDLRLLRIAIESVEYSTPVVQHFMDMAPHDAREFANGFRSLNSRVSELWALTQSMGRELEQTFGRQVQIVSALHQDPPQSSKTRHVRFSSTFRAVMIGNLWQPQLLPFLREVWSLCQADLPSLRPIDWYIHPARVQKLIEGGYELGDEIVWRGFYDGFHLQQKLQSADLALLPFNWGSKADSGYARFSLPSRLTEYCAAGLPVVAVASPDTAPAQFINDRGCGVAISGSTPTQVAHKLKQLIEDHEWRTQAGIQARRLSAGEFSLEPFTQWLRTRLMKIVDESTPKS